MQRSGALQRGAAGRQLEVLGAAAAGQVAQLPPQGVSGLDFVSVAAGAASAVDALLLLA